MSTGTSTSSTSTSGHVDQRLALSPSYLHGGDKVLESFSSHIGQTEEKDYMVIHQGYTNCEIMPRFVFPWADILLYVPLHLFL